MFRQSSKSGLILPRTGIGAFPDVRQGLSRHYADIMPYSRLCNDFREGTGDKAYDRSGYSQHGTLTAGASGANTSVQQMWDNGKAGGVNLDGTNDLLNWGVFSNIFDNSTNKATFIAWAKFGSIAAINVLMGKYSNVTARRDQALYFLSLTTGQLRLLAGTNSSSHYVYWTTDAACVDATNKFMISASVDLSATPRTCDITVNGVSIASTLTSAGTPPTAFRDYGFEASVPFATRIENSTSGDYFIFNGTIYYVNVLKGKLTTAAEMLRIYNAEKPFIK